MRCIRQRSNSKEEYIMSTNMKANRRKTLLLVETAMLTAVILVMSFTRLGYLTVGPLELTLIMVPVIIGAVTEGPAVSAFLGTVFGITSFIQCFTGSPLGAVLVSVSIFRTLIVCVVSRVLAGWLCGLIFKVDTYAQMPRGRPAAMDRRLAASTIKRCWKIRSQLICPPPSADPGA